MIDDSPDDVSDNTASGTQCGPLSAGAALREARTRLGMSVADVANRLKFAPCQIEALEEDDFAHLPEMAFVRGFVRSYAKLLQLDPAPLLAALPGTAVQQPAPPITTTMAETPFPNAYSIRKPNITWLAAALAVAVVLALFALPRGNAPNTSKGAHVETLALPEVLPVSAVPDVKISPQAAAPKVQQAAAKTVATSNVSGQAVAIRLVFDEKSWAEVTDRDGKILLSQINPRGSEQSVDGKPPFSMVIGHARGVHLYYKGEAVNLAPYTNIEVARLTLK